MDIQKISWAFAVVLAGCAGEAATGAPTTGTGTPTPGAPTTGAPTAGTPTGAPTMGTPERKVLTQKECEAQGGGAVGDIGDGATRRPDYLCPSGKPPLGNIAPPTGGPMAIEGAVCCPR
jgi:hypothetical protein